MKFVKSKQYDWKTALNEIYQNIIILFESFQIKYLQNYKLFLIATNNRC